ncbi:hypothetical protein AGLY_007207 [Aphis glycines]|uniref:Endonuclease/exonuclease/phosphatase domain-containing protein n=1 Tax=Aphis glycines TaxID=307491 RepID=A0A6G0TPT2_APHGL|nr:hypothetical protein AGLY_007207 [Aphis glycines]
MQNMKIRRQIQPSQPRGFMMLSEINVLRSENESLKTTTATLKDRIIVLETTIENFLTSTSNSLPQLINELSDREKCSCNVIVHGLDKSSSTKSEDRIFEVTILLTTIIHPLSLSLPSCLTLLRVGRPNTEGPRPVKIVFLSKIVLSNLSRTSTFQHFQHLRSSNKSNTPPVISVVCDRTVEERQEIRRIYADLEARKANDTPTEFYLRVSSKTSTIIEPAFHPPTNPICSQKTNSSGSCKKGSLDIMPVPLSLSPSTICLFISHPSQHVPNFKVSQDSNTKSCACIHFDFFVLTETWLNDSFSSCELGLTNYNIFYRYDRCPVTSNFLRIGGVLIGTRKDLLSKLIFVHDIHVEHLLVMLSVEFSKLITNAAYFPPQCPPLLYEDLMSILENVYQHHPEHTFLLYGDYNLLDISWSNDLHGSILDLMCCNNDSVVDCESLETFVPPDAYHPPLNISFSNISTPMFADDVILDLYPAVWHIDDIDDVILMAIDMI